MLLTSSEPPSPVLTGSKSLLKLFLPLQCSLGRSRKQTPSWLFNWEANCPFYGWFSWPIHTLTANGLSYKMMWVWESTLDLSLSLLAVYLLNLWWLRLIVIWIGLESPWKQTLKCVWAVVSRLHSLRWKDPSSVWVAPFHRPGAWLE